MSKIVFCTFGDKKWEKDVRRIYRQAKNFNLFDEFYIYNENNITDENKKNILDIMNVTKSDRGFGYWSWKSFIICDILSKLSDGDILFYSDSGSYLNYNAKDIFLDYINEAKKNDIFIFDLKAYSQTIRKWTKKITFDYFKNNIWDSKTPSDFDSLLNKEQLEGSTIILVKNKYTVRIMNLWKELMSAKNHILFDDETENELPDFIESRHDQMVLTLILNCNHYSSVNTTVYSNDLRFMLKNIPVFTHMKYALKNLFSLRNIITQFYSVLQFIKLCLAL